MRPSKNHATDGSKPDEYVCALKKQFDKIRPHNVVSSSYFSFYQFISDQVNGTNSYVVNLKAWTDKRNQHIYQRNVQRKKKEKEESERKKEIDANPVKKQTPEFSETKLKGSQSLEIPGRLGQLSPSPHRPMKSSERRTFADLVSCSSTHSSEAKVMTRSEGPANPNNNGRNMTMNEQKDGVNSPQMSPLVKDYASPERFQKLDDHLESSPKHLMEDGEVFESDSFQNYASNCENTDMEAQPTNNEGKKTTANALASLLGDSEMKESVPVKEKPHKQSDTSHLQVLDGFVKQPSKPTSCSKRKSFSREGKKLRFKDISEDGKFIRLEIYVDQNGNHNGETKKYVDGDSSIHPKAKKAKVVGARSRGKDPLKDSEFVTQFGSALEKLDSTTVNKLFTISRRLRSLTKLTDVASMTDCQVKRLHVVGIMEEQCQSTVDLAMRKIQHDFLVEIRSQCKSILGAENNNSAWRGIVHKILGYIYHKLSTYQSQNANGANGDGQIYWEQANIQLRDLKSTVSCPALDDVINATKPEDIEVELFVEKLKSIIHALQELDENI